MFRIFTKKLKLTKSINDSTRTPFYLHITLESDNLHTNTYEKRDNLDFPVVNFPYALPVGDIPKAPSYDTSILYFTTDPIRTYL